MLTATVANYYLPIYFQAVDGVTPTMSGVYLLPSILGQLFAAVIAGRLVMVVGRYLPFALGSAVLASIGYGLCSTFSTHTSTGKPTFMTTLGFQGLTSSLGEWIGYQILFGVGRG